MPLAASGCRWLAVRGSAPLAGLRQGSGRRNRLTAPRKAGDGVGRAALSITYLYISISYFAAAFRAQPGAARRSFVPTRPGQRSGAPSQGEMQRQLPASPLAKISTGIPAPRQELPVALPVRDLAAGGAPTWRHARNNQGGRGPGKWHGTKEEKCTPSEKGNRQPHMTNCCHYFRYPLLKGRAATGGAGREENERRKQGGGAA